ncbi:helix-turn-helix domain-containing protein [Kibdelosporangium lantanae]|uniref:Helix-turn-helix domain-containing protein n=1 Tax=Kibdelosporangium lantanae TaxID=1497396 RepID=A0ABW3M4Y5_9PSEU
MLTGRKYRLAFTSEQAEFAEVIGGTCRSVWNTALNSGASTGGAAHG